jgi:hypothetical protein
MTSAPADVFDPSVSLAKADALVADGRPREAIDLLSAANRRGRNATIEQRLVQLRHAGFAQIDLSQGREVGRPRSRICFPSRGVRQKCTDPTSPHTRSAVGSYGTDVCWFGAWFRRPRLRLSSTPSIAPWRPLPPTPMALPCPRRLRGSCPSSLVPATQWATGDRGSAKPAGSGPLTPPGRCSK